MDWSERDAELEDWEYPDPDDEDESYATFTCSECGGEVLEDLDQCPACGFFVSDNTGNSKLWQTVSILLLIASALGILFSMLSR